MLFGRSGQLGQTRIAKAHRLHALPFRQIARQAVGLDVAFHRDNARDLLDKPRIIFAYGANVGNAHAMTQRLCDDQDAIRRRLRECFVQGGGAVIFAFYRNLIQTCQADFETAQCFL